MRKIVLPLIKKELTKALAAYTTNNLYLLMLLKKNRPNVVNSKFLKGCIGSSELFSEDNLKAFCDILVSFLL